jgi:hypothetical protein
MFNWFKKKRKVSQTDLIDNKEQEVIILASQQSFLRLKEIEGVRTQFIYDDVQHPNTDISFPFCVHRVWFNKELDWKKICVRCSDSHGIFEVDNSIRRIT